MDKNNRLEKAQNSQLHYKSQISRFCVENEIPFSVDFAKTVLDPELGVDANAFKQAYNLPHFTPKGLTERGASVILAMESKQGNNHGEVVAAIADEVASSLMGISNLMTSIDGEDNAKTTLQVQRSINPAFRKSFEKEGNEEIKALMEDNGAAVIVTSIGWEDKKLMMDQPHADEQLEHLWNISAFVVDSTGNDGMTGADGTLEKPFQKHNGVTHGSSLTVRVGAAKWDDKSAGYVVEGYSSANSPTMLGVVHPEVKVNWGLKDDEGKLKEPSDVSGTSAANPWVGGVLDAFNNQFGRYLTREEILYGIISTADKPERVRNFGKKTRAGHALEYVENAAGNAYNPVYAGFGVPNIAKAEKLLAHMVEYAQEHPEQISMAAESTVKYSPPKEEKQKVNEEGKYEYTLEKKAGLNLNVTFGVLFEDKRGDVVVTSPSGTTLPLTLSVGKNADATSPVNRFSISTTEGFAGEMTEGKWKVTSTTPIESLKIRSYSMKANDLVKDVRYDDVAQLPMPDLSRAKPLDKLIDFDDLLQGRERNRRDESELSINGRHPDLNDAQEIVEMLRYSPDGIPNNQRTRVNTVLRYNVEGEGAIHENAAYAASNIHVKDNMDEASLLEAAQEFKIAAAAYEIVGADLAAANMYSLAAQSFGKFSTNELFEDKPYSEHAVEMFDKAVALHQQQGHADFEYRDRDLLAGALVDTHDAYKALGSDAGVEQYQKRLGEESSLLLNASRNRQAVLDESAVRVEQREMGFSDDCPIGTDSVSQCLTVIAQAGSPASLTDKHDKTVGLVHIDYESDVKSLDNFFERLPEGKKQVRLVGARFDRDVKSVRNIVNVINKLAERDIDIISADVMGGDAGVSAVVVDPATFMIKEAVPGKKNPDFNVANAHVLLAEDVGAEAMKVAVDLRKSEGRAPILLDEDDVNILRTRYVGKDDVEMYKSLGSAGFSDKGLSLAYIKGTVEAYEEAVVESKEYVKGKANRIGVEETLPGGVKTTVPLVDMEGMLGLVDRSAIYVGENAKAFNERHIDRITEHLEVREGRIEVKEQAMETLIADRAVDNYTQMEEHAGEASKGFSDRVRSGDLRRPDGGNGRGGK